MTNRVITLEAFRAVYNTAYASLDRACDDLRSVSIVVGELDPFLPGLESSANIHVNAAALRAQAAHVIRAALVLNEAASSFETLAAVLGQAPIASTAAAKPRAKRTSSVVGKPKRKKR